MFCFGFKTPLQEFYNFDHSYGLKRLYDEATDTPTKANTSDLNEDLGQIEYLFSDKTGTLTDNAMEFKQFSIDGVIYHEQKGQLCKLGTDEKTEFSKSSFFEKFFQVLSLCHTVQVDHSLTEAYQASSPDELSFVKFCAKLDIVFRGDSKDEQKSPAGNMVRSVTIRGQEFYYEVLSIFDFDSTRKRMSVILKDLQSQKHVLLCKGAESSIFKCCKSGAIQAASADIKQFSLQGWRTLALAHRTLSAKEYEEIDRKVKAAYSDIIKRNLMLAQAYDEIESNLELVGATAVEDKLQDKVADTLECLRDAGIKIWVLTGDKKETAVNISNSCKHFSNDMIKFEVTDLKTTEQIEKQINRVKEK